MNETTVSLTEDGVWPDHSCEYRGNRNRWRTKKSFLMISCNQAHLQRTLGKSEPSCLQA